MGKGRSKSKLESLVRGHTINGGYRLRLDDRPGSIEVGKMADLIVLDHNLFEADRYEIHKIRLEAVLMEGKLIQGGLKLSIISPDLRR